MERTCAKTIRLDKLDNVAVALEDLPAGSLVEGGFRLRESVPTGHKVALCDIAESGALRKYGQVIGFASREIRQGDHVHLQNLEMKEVARDHAIGAERRQTNLVAVLDRASFSGIIRPDGRAATRNYLGVLATVNCSASVARMIADQFKDLSPYPNLDGVVALGHGSGCCMIPGGEAHRLLQRSLAGYARHPNFAGVVLVGLGCEVNQLEGLMQDMGLKNLPNIIGVDIQEAGGTRETIRRGVEAVNSLIPLATGVKRQPVSAEHLVLGLECGGSDAYSGITANPALGVAADLLVSQGGTVILSETPEIYGAEHLLTRRAGSREAGEKLLARIRWWEDYTARNGGSIDNNPSPGNKAGGITNVWEKSLGAVAKAGSTNLIEVYQYAEEIRTSGLVFMDTPGYDVVSITGMVAGGANMVCFTTGRGSVFGCKPVPVVKIASHTPLYKRMPDDIDFNCGVVIDGAMSLQEAGESIFRMLLEAASGVKTLSEVQGMGDMEFVPWHLGAVT
ncbi:MAG: altronate dehydratase family protein [Smithellaceae bacterium]|nr:altronate dehydratase family protein [Smithellaceae bacterium]